MSEPQKLRSPWLAVLLFVGSVAVLLGLLATQAFCLPSAQGHAVNVAESFNQGNADYALGRYGEALWNYERARQTAPRDDAILQNIALARKALEMSEPAPSRVERLSALLDSEGWVAVGLVGLWASVFIVLIMAMMHWRGAIPVGLLVLSLLFLGVGAMGTISTLKARQGGIAVKATPLKVAPTRQSPAGELLPEGQSARVLDIHGDYAKVKTPSGKIGWVSLDGFKPYF